jgi:hypothetical protein
MTVITTVAMVIMLVFWALWDNMTVITTVAMVKMLVFWALWDNIYDCSLAHIFPSSLRSDFLIFMY